MKYTLPLDRGRVRVGVDSINRQVFRLLPPRRPS